MKIIDEIISALADDHPVTNVLVGAHQSAVTSKYCGLSSILRDEDLPHGGPAVREAGNLTRKTARELATGALSNNLLEAAIGMAAINSLIPVDENKCVELNAFEILKDKGHNKSLTVIGHFPFIPELKKFTKKLWVLEKRLQPGDLPADIADDILPASDVVAITATTFINHTLEDLLPLCKNSFVVMLGPTTPLTPLLFDHGIDVLCGVKVIEPQKALRYISEGANFRQIKGIKRLTITKE